MDFTHESLAQRIVFATGRSVASSVAEIEALGRSSVFLIASDRDRDLVERMTVAMESAGLRVSLHNEVVMHVPIEVAQRARAAAAAAKADVVMTVGGGSATGLGKAVVMGDSPLAGLPLIAVPTTYSGSEATNVWGLTRGLTKTTGVDERVLPRSIVYDAALLASLPREAAVASGYNALAHAVDAMWGPKADPIYRVFAQEGIRGLVTGLASVARNPTTVAGIEQTLYGAYLAAVSFAGAGSGLHHKICHVLGGMFGLPHAQTHAIVLPHVVAFNAPSAPEAEARIAAGFGSATALEGLRSLSEQAIAPTALKDYGMPEDGIGKAVGPILAAVPAGNPTPVTDQNLTALLRAAWEGDAP